MNPEMARGLHERGMSLTSLVGQAIRPLRAGEEKLLHHQLGLASTSATITVESSAFVDGGRIPNRYTVCAADISPPLSWSGFPAGARDILLVIEDYDVPLLSPMVHLIAYQLRDGLAEGALPNREGVGLDPTIKVGRNGLGYEHYDGPAPPPGHGVHHYVFQLFALDRPLEFGATPDRAEIAEAIKGHVLDFGLLVGTFER